MAKIFTEIELDRPRKMRFGYKIVKKMDSISKEFEGKNQYELLEKLVFLALKEDDPDLKEEQIEDFIDEFGMEPIGLALEETIARDMPGLMELIKKEQEKEQEKEEVDNPNE